MEQLEALDKDGHAVRVGQRVVCLALALPRVGDVACFHACRGSGFGVRVSISQLGSGSNVVPRRARPGLAGLAGLIWTGLGQRVR